jgi:ABC-type multidrug transport system fused ATPase/permease subunit
MLIMFGPVRRFAELNMTYQTSVCAIRRVFRLLDVTPSIVDPPLSRAHRGPPPRGHIRFANVCFRYEDQSEEARAHIEDDEPIRRPNPPGAWVLDGVSFEARPGERIAIVGPSGAGKTTLVSLVPRLYDACSGKVELDGVDVRDYSLHALRSAIAIVQQDSFVFSGSIHDNIAYGRPEATDEEIIEAALAAHAHEFISRLPNGYGTILGERGVNLSGGQRQRISIARALLKNPRILILDEATSSLDTQSESVVQHALETLMRARTCLVVAHRLSTIRDADRIVVLEHGRVAEIGTHDDLLADDGVYASLVKHQTSLAPG